MISSGDLYAMLYFGGIAFALAIGMVVVQAVFVELESRVGRWMMPLVLPAIVMAQMLGVLLGGRNLRYASMNVGTIGGQVEGGGGVLRAITVFVLAICLAKILGHLARFRGNARRAGAVGLQPQASFAQLLYVSFAAFFLCENVFAAAFGTEPVFQHNSMYPIVVFTAAYVARDEPIEPLIHGAKFVLLLMMVGSLALALVKPDMAMLRDYGVGWIPGFTIRLWGLGSNANSIGPIALTLMLLELLQPTRIFGVRMLIWLSSLAVLFMAQSKTTWAASMLTLLIVWAYRSGRSEHGGLRIGFVLFLIGVAIAGALSLLFVDFDHVINRLGMTQAGADVTTMSGRLQIWVAAIRAWQESPYFGYGPDAWGPLFRLRLGMPFAFHAHNQFLQSLSEAGIFGFVACVVYFGVLVRVSLAAASWTRGVSLGLIIFYALRCMTEAPLELNGLGSAEVMMQLLMFMILLRTARPAGKIPVVIAS